MAIAKWIRNHVYCVANFINTLLNYIHPLIDIKISRNEVYCFLKRRDKFTGSYI